MHTNYILRQQYTRLLKTQQKDEMDDETDNVTLKTYIDDSIRKTKETIELDIVKMEHENRIYIDNSLEKLRQEEESKTELNTYIETSINKKIQEEFSKVDHVEKYIDTFTFDCKRQRVLLFELQLIQKDFEEVTLLNTVANGVYKIAIRGSEKTAPKRFISGKIKSTSSNLITRSNFENIHVQLNRSYILTINVIEEARKLIACLALKDFVANGSFSKFK